MNPRHPIQLHLVPEQGIDIIDGQTVALACPAWLRIEPVGELARRKWIKLRYSSSFFDEPVRPLIRFVTKKVDIIVQPMNGAVLGSAEWIGRIPDGTVSASISPVQRTGPFAFWLDCIGSVGRTDLARQGFRRDRDWLYWAARSRLINSRREAWQALGFATGGTPISDYPAWHRSLVRPLDLNGLDRPRSDWRSGPAFRLILRLTEGRDPSLLHDTVRSLRGQAYPRWSVSAVREPGAVEAMVAAFRKQASGDPRMSEVISAVDGAEPFANSLGASDFVAVIDCGDRLAEYALAVAAETLARDPELDLIYCDEDRITTQGNLERPILKPDWSPALQARVGYVGRLALLRSRFVTEKRFRHLVSDEDQLIDEITAEIPRSNIRHIRRILYSRYISRSAVTLEPQLRTHATDAEPAQWPDVAVVIPTRNRAKLLAECFVGLTKKTDYPSFEIIIVDNGSHATSAIRLLRKIAKASRTTILSRPGPFNYSAMCNDAAGATKAQVIVFLNNDVVMIEPHWLRALVSWAIKPDVGVVGAKLLFPNRVIQHAGVVIGFGGIAGHIYRRLPADHRGYLAQLTVPHEVAAVTGACIAIERAKFEAVGGFDAEHLPVDLNDIDFCLRIAERGWTNIWTPEATLIHHQSATRGIDRNPFALYRKERSYFVERWAHVIRDDPYFHPGLSLYAHDVALA